MRSFFMTNEKIKRMFDAFYQAKRIRDMLPPLPQGVMPSYIQYLDAIHSLQKEKKDIRISGSLISVMPCTFRVRVSPEQ